MTNTAPCASITMMGMSSSVYRGAACPACHAQGRIDRCEACGGTGTLVCDLCNGSGSRVTPGESAKRVVCTCESGYFTCAACSGGTGVCGNCGGTGLLG
jgi:hypothetical protein